jgi:Rrf2 family protein
VIFSTKAEYGVRLLIELGRQDGGQPTPLNVIAQAEQLPLAYLEHIVAALKRAELVTSVRGAQGGYRLAKPAQQIKMRQAVEALEGAISPMECFDHEHTERVLCSHERDGGQACATKLLWTRVQLGMLKALQETTLAELVDFATRHSSLPSANKPQINYTGQKYD